MHSVMECLFFLYPSRPGNRPKLAKNIFEAIFWPNPVNFAELF